MAAFVGAPLLGAMAASRAADVANNFLGAMPTNAAHSVRNLRGPPADLGAAAAAPARRGARSGVGAAPQGAAAGAHAAGAGARAGALAAGALAMQRRAKRARQRQRGAAARRAAGETRTEADTETGVAEARAAMEAAKLELEAARLRSEAAEMERAQAEERRGELARRLLSPGADQAPLPGLGAAALPGRLREACEFEASEEAVKALFEACGRHPDSSELTLDELSSPAFHAKLDSLISEDKAQRRLAEFEAREKERKEAAEQRGDDAAQVSSSVSFEENDDRGAATRLLACLAYLLPLSDGFQFGVKLVELVPATLPLFVGLAVPASLLNAIPFGSLILFFIMTTSANNLELPRLLRFNLQQAVVLDVLLFIPQFLVQIVGFVTGGGIGVSQDFLVAVFILLIAACVYSIGRTLIFGEDPDGLPIVSDATKRGIDRGRF